MDLQKFNIIIPPQDIEEHPECLQKIAAGDRSAYEWLYKNYCSKLYNYLLLLTNEKYFAEDLVQEVFLKVWDNREKLTTVVNFNSYLFILARNLLSDKWRKKEVEKEHLKVFAKGQQDMQQNGFFEREQERIVNAAVRKLSPKQQLVYRLIREEGMKREEVSKALNITPNTVKVTMQNALAGLRRELKES